LGSITLDRLVTRTFRSRVDAVSIRKLQQKGPCQYRLAATSAAILEAHVNEIQGITGSAANEDLNVMLAREPDFEVFPVRRVAIRPVSLANLVALRG
jgi:hypothetical protein